MKRLEVGDRVRVISHSVVPVGTVGTVLANDGTVFPYKVRFEDRPDIPVWLSRFQLEKVSASQPSGRELQVGDMVRIKSREWYEDNKDPFGYIHSRCGFTSRMAEFCGKTFKIAEALYNGVYKLEGAGGFVFDSSMFDFSAPSSVITAKSLDARIKDAVKGVCGAFSKPTVKVSLIKANKLLTNIKVD